MKAKIMGALFAVLCLLTLAGCAEKFTQEQVDTILATQEAQLTNAFKPQLDSALTVQDQLRGQLAELTVSLETEKANSEELGSQIAALQAEQLAAESETAAGETETTIEGGVFYLVEDVPLYGDFFCSIDNDDLSTLAYSDLKYDDETLDYEEKLYFSPDFAPVRNLEDFGSEVLVGMNDEYAIAYKLEFHDPIQFVADEELSLRFLGQDYTFVDYNSGMLTFRVSTQYEGGYGDEWNIDGTIVKILQVDGDNQRVRIQVGDETKTVEEGSEKQVGGMSVYIDEVFVATIPVDTAWVSFYIGEDIVQEVRDGDEFMDLEDWEWVLEDDGTDLTALGVIYAQDIVDEEDVWHVGDGICFPLEYKCITFAEVKNAEVQVASLDITNSKLKVTYDGKVEIDGDRIDDSRFTVDLTAAPLEYEYRYKGNPLVGTNFSKIVFSQGDREFGFGMNANTVRIGLNDPSGYRFNYVPGEFTDAFDGAAKMNDDNDYRMANGDILYKSEVNDASDEENGVKIGFVSDEALEVILKVK